MKQYFILLCALVFLLPSCNKNAESISEEEAVAMVEATMNRRKLGVGRDLEAAGGGNAGLNPFTPGCGILGQTSTQGNVEQPSFERDLSWRAEWGIDCNEPTNEPLVYFATRNGTYSGPSWSYEGSGETNLEVYRLNTGSFFLMFGSFDFSASASLYRKGAYIPYEVSYKIVFDRLSAVRENGRIHQGTAEFSLQFDGEEQSQLFSGTLDFLGYNTVEVTIGEHVQQLNY